MDSHSRIHNTIVARQKRIIEYPLLSGNDCIITKEDKRGDVDLYMVIVCVVSGRQRCKISVLSLRESTSPLIKIAIGHFTSCTYPY